jgi:Protein of unknown function (DUF551)
MSEWISVKERLPMECKSAWLWNGEEVSAEFIPEWGDDEAFHQWLEEYGITHWQSYNIPPPPQESGKVGE